MGIYCLGGETERGPSSDSILVLPELLTHLLHFRPASPGNHIVEHANCLRVVDGRVFEHAPKLVVARDVRLVTAQMSDKGDVFWVRMNNSTRALPEIEIERYVGDHWAPDAGLQYVGAGGLEPPIPRV